MNTGVALASAKIFQHRSTTHFMMNKDTSDQVLIFVCDHALFQNISKKAVKSI